MGSKRAEGGMALATSFTQPPGRCRAGEEDGNRRLGNVATGRIRGEPDLGSLTGTMALGRLEGKPAIWRPTGALATSREAGATGRSRRRGVKAELLLLGAGQAGRGLVMRTETGLTAGRLAWKSGDDPVPSGRNKGLCPLAV
jgi:hypothetical protein